MTLDTWIAAELLMLARMDALETFEGESIAYWYCDVKAEDPPPPRREWADKATELFPGRFATDEEWEHYQRHYKIALARGIRYLDKHWPEDAAAFDDPEFYNDFSEAASEAIKVQP